MKKKNLRETASYKKLVQNEGEFDTIPDSFYSTESGYPVPENPGLSSTLYEEEEERGDEEMELPSEAPPESPPEAEPGADLEEEKSVNELQNEIIRYNIETLKSIHSQINDLNNSISTLNSRFDDLNRDVEEVREPTNVEKLVQQKDVSYPYYFNLNDFWKGNWFERMYSNESPEEMVDGETTEKGVRKLPDGTYVANLEDLPDKSFIDIEKSFSDIV